LILIANMIELENERIGFAAVHTRVSPEVLEDQVGVALPIAISVRVHVRLMLGAVLEVPGSLAVPAVPLIPELARAIEVL
jgi:hypothetical protein